MHHVQKISTSTPKILKKVARFSDACHTQNYLMDQDFVRLLLLTKSMVDKVVVHKRETSFGSKNE